MNRMLIVAWREFRQTVMTKAFFLGSVVVPVLLVVISIGAEHFLKPNIPPLTGTLFIVGGDEPFVDLLDDRLRPKEETSPAVAIDTSSTDAMVESAIAASAAQENRSRVDTSKLKLETELASKIDDVKEMIRNGDAAGLIQIHENTLTSKADKGGRLTILVAPKAPPSHLDLLKKASRNAVIDRRLGVMGIQPESIRKAMKSPRLNTVRIGTKGDEREESEFTRMAIPMGFMILLWIVTFTGGNYLMMSTIEEKSTRAMEVLLSAVSPASLLTGKIIGFAAVSLVMLGMYLGVVVVLLTVFAALDIVSLGDIVLAAVFFLMAYLMIAAIMAGIGSAVNDITEAQSLMGPAMVILILPMLLMGVITEDPNGSIAMIGSFIPPLSPFVMVLRIAASPEPLPTMQLIVTIIWGMLCTAGMIWTASRVFRVGVLMQGKPPSPLELLRWVRYR